ncbi:MAG: ATP synthase F1 subunit epsilon [Prolixibacteraceae bacterium]
MYIEVITPDRKLFAGEIRLVKLPGTMGSFEILKNHAPIISTLEKGEIKIKGMHGEITLIEISGGLVESKDNRIIVLAEPVA